MCVEGNDLIGQTRASGILAELYHSFGQEFQAYEYFKKVQTHTQTQTHHRQLDPVCLHGKHTCQHDSL